MTERRHDLDWLRVLAIIVLHFFHAAMPFVSEWWWHLKDPNDQSGALLEINYFFSRWRMPLLFFISGLGTGILLGKIAWPSYLLQRTKRLLVPLIFGVLIIVPPQTFVERLQQSAAYYSVLDVYPYLFTTGLYPEGNFTWNHLWFIAYLFIYSVLCLPLFLYLRSEAGATLVDAVARFTEKFGLYLFVLPPFLGHLLYFTYENPYKDTYLLINDEANFFRHLGYFLVGYFIGTHKGFWGQIESQRRKHLVIGFFTVLFMNYCRWNGIGPHWKFDAMNLGFILLRYVSAWAWMLAVLGYAKKYFNFRNKFLDYANEGIYPFYILHQTAIIVIGYYIVQMPDEVMMKYFFLSFSSFAVCIGLYEFAIRPYAYPRFFFGMKSGLKPWFFRKKPPIT